MTDPNVGCSIYISDRDREKMELEKRKQQMKEEYSRPNIDPTPSQIAPPPPPNPIITSSIASNIDENLDNVPSESSTSLQSSNATVDLEVEALLASQSLPIVTVTNIHKDEGQKWKEKYAMSKMLEDGAICDKCENCFAYEHSEGSVCLNCGCSLIFHLKDENESREQDESGEDEEEWEDDDEAFDDSNDGDFVVQQYPTASSSNDINEKMDHEEEEGEYGEYEEDIEEVEDTGNPTTMGAKSGSPNDQGGEDDLD